MNSDGEYQGLSRSQSNYWEDGDPHDVHTVLTHKETTLRSIVDDRFYWAILPYQHDDMVVAAFKLYLEDNNLKEFSDTCIRFLVHTIAKKQYYTQYDLLSRARDNYYCDVLIPVLHTDSMQAAWEEYHEHFQKYVEACKEAMIKDLLARSKVV